MNDESNKTTTEERPTGSTPLGCSVDNRLLIGLFIVWMQQRGIFLCHTTIGEIEKTYCVNVKELVSEFCAGLEQQNNLINT